MKKSELRALIKEVVSEVGARGMGQEYMLYSNGDNGSLGFGTIDYIAEILSDFVTKGRPENLPIRGDEQSVKKAILAYNAKSKLHLMLLKSLV